MAEYKIYALLIGINEYDYFEKEVGEFNLFGCIKDSQSIAEYLKESVEEAPTRLFIRNLNSPINSPKNSEGGASDCASEEFFLATRQQIVAGFQDFLTQATKDDIVLIYFSGHGLTYDQPKELWHLTQENNSKHQGQSLMCADTYTGEEKDWIPALKDWEIRWLMQQIAGKEEEKPYIIMLSDCCYSGGNTRDFDQSMGIKVRGISDSKLKSAPKKRSIKEFIFYQNSKETKKILKKQPERFTLPTVRHIALSAAHNYELAKEMDFEEGRFGIFTYFLLQTLRTTKNQISYRDLIKIIRAKTLHQISFQTPQLYAVNTEDADLPFLNGGVVKQAAYYLVRPLMGKEKEKYKENIGLMEGGSLHGIPRETEGITELIFIPPANKNLATTLPQKGHLIKVGPQSSIVQFDSTWTFSKDLPFLKAKIGSTPIPKTKVYLGIEGRNSKRKTNGLNLLKAALAHSPFLETVTQKKATQYRLLAYLHQGAEKYRITKMEQQKALVAPKIGFQSISANLLVKEMEHIARWERTLFLNNPNPTTIQPHDIELVAIDQNGTEWTDGFLELNATKDFTPELRLKIKMNNKKQVPLYCALVHLTSNYGIETNYLAPETHLGKKKYTDDTKKIRWKQWEIYALSHIEINGQTHPNGLPFGFTISDEKFQQGITTTDDHFKLIVSTEQFDARHLYQGSLASPKGVRDFSDLLAQNPLEALMQKIQTRKKKKKKKRKKGSTPPDWWTSLLTVRTTRIS